MNGTLFDVQFEVRVVISLWAADNVHQGPGLVSADLLDFICVGAIFPSDQKAARRTMPLSHIAPVPDAYVRHANGAHCLLYRAFHNLRSIVASIGCCSGNFYGTDGIPAALGKAAALETISENFAPRICIGRGRFGGRLTSFIEVMGDIPGLGSICKRSTRRYTGILIGRTILPAAVMTSATRAGKVVLHVSGIGCGSSCHRYR